MTGLVAPSTLITAYVYKKERLLDDEASLMLYSKTVEFIDKLHTKELVKVAITPLPVSVLTHASFTTRSFCQILHLMAVMKNRNKDVIGNLVYALYRRPGMLSINQIANLFYACATLKVC